MQGAFSIVISTRLDRLPYNKVAVYRHSNSFNRVHNPCCMNINSAKLFGRNLSGNNYYPDQLTQLKQYQIRKDCMKTRMSGGE